MEFWKLLYWNVLQCNTGKLEDNAGRLEYNWTRWEISWEEKRVREHKENGNGMRSHRRANMDQQVKEVELVNY